MKIFQIVAFLLVGAVAQADVLTSQNTYGVETIEAPSMQFYLAPNMAWNAVGANGSTVNSELGYQISAGILLSQQILIEGGFSKPKATVSTGNLSAVHDRTRFDLGARLFVFGRESRFRPYLAGGGIYSLNELSGANGGNYSLNQFLARGSLGLEIALNSFLVLNAQVGIEGVVTYWAYDDARNNANPNFSREILTAANSLSRAPNYAFSLGMGLYF